MAIGSAYSCKHTLFPHISLTPITHVGSPKTRTNLLIYRGKENAKFATGNARKCIVNHKRKLWVPTFAGTSDSGFDTISLAETVEKFYICINEGDRKGLEELIGNNCQLDDSSFPYVIQGKKEVIGLLVQLSESMGENVHFKLGTICEGDDLTASVNWHLDWKDDHIPFSRGCSIFQCSNEGDKLVVRKAQIITESPIKPGIFAMALLRIVTSFFNDFPNAAKWFLKSPNIILRAAMNIYNLFFAPIVNPIITFYITLWKFVARFLGYAMSFLKIIAKLVNKGSNLSVDKNDSQISTSTLESDQGPTTLP